MACTQTLKGLAQSCETNLAGIRKVYIANFEDVKSVALGTSEDKPFGDASITIADIVMNSTKKFHAYNFAKQTGSLTSTLTVDETNGVRYYTNEIVLQFNKMEAKKHLEVEALAAGQLAVIVADNNGKYWYVGADNYVSASAATAQSGQSFGDLNGYNTTMSAMSAYMPFEITGENGAALKDTDFTGENGIAEEAA